MNKARTREAGRAFQAARPDTAAEPRANPSSSHNTERTETTHTDNNTQTEITHSISERTLHYNRDGGSRGRGVRGARERGATRTFTTRAATKETFSIVGFIYQAGRMLLTLILRYYFSRFACACGTCF